MKKKITRTLPINNKLIFETLADCYYYIENPGQNKKDYIEQVIQDLGIEAYTKSLTSEGNISSGDNLMQNPHSARISKSFYDIKEIANFIGPAGKVTSIFNKGKVSDQKKKMRLFRFKSSIVNLVQLYLESAMSMNMGGKSKNKKEYIVSDFNYKKRTNETDLEWYRYLVQVENNKYIRLFVATIFFITISELFLIDVKDMTDTIKIQNLDNTKNIKSDTELKTLKKKFAKLKDPKNRDSFIRKVNKMWKLELKAPKEVQTSFNFESEEES